MSLRRGWYTKQQLPEVAAYKSGDLVYILKRVGGPGWRGRIEKFEGIVIRPLETRVYVRYQDKTGCWFFASYKPDKLERRTKS